MTCRPYAVSWGDCVVALLADPGELLVGRSHVRRVARSLAVFGGVWPTVTNFVPPWMRPGDVFRVYVTDLTFHARTRPRGNTPTGTTPAYLDQYIAADRMRPGPCVYVNKFVSPDRLWRTALHELRHLWLGTDAHRDGSQDQLGNPTPGRWHALDEIPPQEAAVAAYLENMQQSSRDGAQIKWGSRKPEDTRDWDVDPLAAVLQEPLP